MDHVGVRGTTVGFIGHLDVLDVDQQEFLVLLLVTVPSTSVAAVHGAPHSSSTALSTCRLGSDLGDAGPG